MQSEINANDSSSYERGGQKKVNSQLLYAAPGVLLAFVAFICGFKPVSALPGAQSELVPVKGELGYKQRSDNRKEGFYEKSTGGNLHVVSLLYHYI